jgi:hypothetical protein
MQRRLAAILIADVAGYGRLSEANEEQTRAQFQADLKDISWSSNRCQQWPLGQDDRR